MKDREHARCAAAVAHEARISTKGVYAIAHVKKLRNIFVFYYFVIIFADFF
jgi:hypothetical protein